jgi:hypothetical protein
MVDDRGVARGPRISDLRIRGGQNDVPDRFKGDSVVAGVEEDEGLPGCSRPIGTRVDADRPLARSSGDRFKGRLDVTSRV